jgi:hypothetical protein
VLSVLRFTDSDWPYCIYWPLCCLSFYWWILIAPMVSIGHCVVCPSFIYGFWLPLWYLLTIVLSVLRLTDYDYPYGIYWPLCCLSFYLLYGIYWPLCCLSFFDLRILIAPIVFIVHCVVCPSSIYGFWLPILYLLVIVLFVLLRFTDSDRPYGIYWALCCLSFFDLQILITP